jgi:hypothetical protein
MGKEKNNGKQIISVPVCVLHSYHTELTVLLFLYHFRVIFNFLKESPLHAFLERYMKPVQI